MNVLMILLTAARRSWLVMVAAVLAAAGLGAVAPAHSALAAAAAPGAGGAAAVSVPCSAATLVRDVGMVSSTGGTVTLASGCVYKLTAQNNSTDGGTGLPVINGNVTVQGNGATITRSATAPFRLFDVAAGGSLTLAGLTLSNG